MVFHKVSIYIYTHIYGVRVDVYNVSKKCILKGILLAFPQGIVEDILQGCIGCIL